ncbi:hypothetical protein BX285_3262 [Streptomyces sp. 1114.5]|uniref:hypothetical protein n=1 Tax=Streptomyces sp. 1114.5 TaxID=1938830 RepID=UPI000F157120|nr:hypothetical protein [Streptomyces sp. 1114.5]RKT18830.1 hypothetical protein BX285_3262 [Streptomyces sp. 1114.5]
MSEGVALDAEITEIATRGATVLAGLMVTSAWERVRPRIAAMFGHRAESVSEELDETQAELVAAQEGDSESAARSAQGEWAPKLRRLLAANPAMVTELRSILDEFEPEVSEQATTVNYITNTHNGGGSTYNDTVIQAGIIHNLKR